MRPLLIVLILFAGCLWAFSAYKERDRAARESASDVAAARPAAPPRSLEERAAAAQGTTLPADVPRSVPRAISSEPVERAAPAAPAVSAEKFHCDGRVSCPQMHSCEEATWFLQHCPGMQMDGDSDGIPCESQWCRRASSR
jgi:hypothetical protein